MTRTRLLFAWIVALLLTTLPVSAEVSLQTRVSTRRPELGDSFTVQLTALSDSDELPSGPSLSPPPGFAMHGPSITSQQQVSISGGRITQRRGITATWTLVPSRVGRMAIGPPSVTIGGRRMTGDRVTVEVVPAGQGGRSPGGLIDPLDPFSFPGMPRLPTLPTPGDLELPDFSDVPPFPDELKLDRAKDPYAFLHGVATPKRVVVGEQVTLKIYAYGRHGAFREASTSEPSRPDFLAHTILENSYGERSHRVPIEGQLWIAQKVREIALFPIRSGTLTVGPMRMGFDGRGYPSIGGKGLTRESDAIQIVVTEPPLAGRPPGYQIGDVGQFTLTANVEPREVMAGEAIGVIATLDGTGNLPFKLKLPQQHGVEWLEPTIVNDVEVRGSTVGGTRKFTYVVRLNEAGRVELGDLALPFWDPTRGAYRVANAALGAIEVKTNPNGKPRAAAADTDRLAGLLGVRKTLGPAATPRAAWSDSSWFWLLLALGPVGIVLTGAGIQVGKRVRRRLSEARESASTVAGRELGEARRGGDLRKTAGHVERALVAAIEARTGLRARGVLREELAAKLEAQGVAPEDALELKAVLDECDQIRFTGEALDAKADLVTRAEAVLRALGRRRSETRSAA